MSKLIKYVIGIGIAKDKFDVCLMNLDVELNSKVKASRKFTNTESGFKEFYQWMPKHCKEKVPVQILMEASGVYREKLAIWLTEKEKQVFVVLPNKARAYMKSLGLKSKNDKIDAQGLALMCAQQKFDTWQPIAKYYCQLRILTRHYQSLQEQKTALKNQLHVLQHSAYISKEVNKQLEKVIAFTDKQIKEIKALISKHIDANEEVKRKVSQICKIKGIHILTVANVIAETNGFELFKNQRQLVSYAGYDVIENESGKYIGKTRISKKGNPRIRRILHMPALNMVRFEQTPFLNLYQRIYEKTKIKMKGYVAVQKKILVIIYSLWKNDQPYRSDYEQKRTSGNEEHSVLFPFFSEGENLGNIKKVVLPKGSTTQDEHRCNESHEVLFP